MPRRRKVLLAMGLVGVLLVGFLGAFSLGAFRGLSPAQLAAIRAAQHAAAVRRLLAAERSEITKASRSLTFALPTKAGAPAPVVAPSLFAKPLPAHQVLGFAPYWELANLGTDDYVDMTTISYFGLELSPVGDGTITESGPAWTTLNSSTFSAFHAQARSAGDRILLTISTTDIGTIDKLLAHPEATSSELANQLAGLISADGFDGVDIDIEGVGTERRAGFVTFAQDLTARIRSAQPSDEIVLDTYPQSATGSSDFFDVKALAPLVNDLFVMAYAMYSPVQASANSPAYSPTLGLSDVGSLRDYVKVVPRSKILFGLPFYGLDFMTTSTGIGAPTQPSDPEEVTYSAVTGVGRVARFDPTSVTLFTTFRLGSQWHETWYDDPTTLALKASLAMEFGVAGVGVWALGQEGSDPAMLEALAGGSPPVKVAAATGG